MCQLSFELLVAANKKGPCRVGQGPRGLLEGSERQAHRASESTAAEFVSGNVSKQRVRVDVKFRVWRRRMIQHVCCIHSDLQALGFGQLERLAHARIEVPDTGARDGSHAIGASCPGPGILEKNLTRGCARESVVRAQLIERARAPQVSSKIPSHPVGNIR